MVTSIKAEPRITVGSSGIYDLGQEDSSLRVFITDKGRTLAVDRIITEEDLMKAYQWGREEEAETQDAVRNYKQPPFAEAEVVSQNASLQYACQGVTPLADEDLAF